MSSPGKYLLTSQSSRELRSPLPLFFWKLDIQCHIPNLETETQEKKNNRYFQISGPPQLQVLRGSSPQLPPLLGPADSLLTGDVEGALPTSTIWTVSMWGNHHPLLLDSPSEVMRSFLPHNNPREGPQALSHCPQRIWTLSKEIETSQINTTGK